MTPTAKKMKMMFAAAVMLSAGILVGAPNAAQADYGQSMLGVNRTLRTPLVPGAQYADPLQPPVDGQAPPIGSGDIPNGVIPGDVIDPIAPPSGQSDPSTGNIFPWRNGPDTKAPAIYVPNAGRRVTEKGQEQGVYDYGQQSTGNRTVNDGGSISNSADTVNNGGPRSNAAGKMDTIYTHDVQPSLYNPTFVLPTVRTFCRYLVILGVVAATVFMSQAAVGMVMGNQHAGSRAIGAAAGLLMLLAGYTIWKIVQLNTMHANSTGWESHYRDGTPQVLGQRGTSSWLTTPSTPSGPFGGAASPGP